MRTHAELWRQATAVIPGGVNSPVRAFRAVGGTPIFIRSAAGSRITDIEGREYIDYLGSWGPMILGHARREVVEAVQAAALRGLSYGAPTENEVRLAQAIGRFFPSIEKVRLVNSGTEATMSALRLARAYAARSLVVKFDGCYHGHADSLLVQAGSGVATLGLSDSPGVPEAFARQTLSLPFNNLAILEEAFERHSDQIAAVILEPVTGNMGVIVPPRRYLQGVIDLCRAHGAVSIFDEVMSGFRVAPGGAQQRFDLRPDLTCLGKIVGGGLPIGAYGGRAEIMDMVAPSGSVYQAGTLSGNPIAVSGGLATLQLLESEAPHAALEEKTSRLCRAIEDSARRIGTPLQVQHCGSMFTVFFSDQAVRDYEGARCCDTQLFARFFHGLLKRGIYTAPSQFEACFLSSAHDEEDLERTAQAADQALREAVGPSGSEEAIR